MSIARSSTRSLARVFSCVLARAPLSYLRKPPRSTAPLQADISLALSCTRMRLSLCALSRLEHFFAGERQNCDLGALRSTNVDERCQDLMIKSGSVMVFQSTLLLALPLPA